MSNFLRKYLQTNNRGLLTKDEIADFHISVRKVMFYGLNHY